MRTKRTTSRLLSILLCLVMVLGLLPTAAFAAGTGDGTKGNPVVVTTYAALKSEMERSGSGNIHYIQLGGDINSGDLRLDETIYVTGLVELDLNGHTLTLNTTSSAVYYFIRVYGTLTIEDSSTSSTGTIEMKHDNNYAGFKGVLVDGKLTVNGGTLKSENEAYRNCGYVICNNVNGTVEINGGTISNIDGYGGSGKLWQNSLALYDVRGSKSVTINGGTFDGLVTIYASKLESGGEAAKVISGGTFNDSVVFDAASNTNGPLDVAVRGGTFKTNFRAGETDNRSTYKYFQQFKVTEYYNNDKKWMPNFDEKAFASIFPDSATILLHAYSYVRSYDNATYDEAAVVLSGSDDAETLWEKIRGVICPTITVFSGGLSDLTLTAGKTTITESNDSGKGSIEPGESSKTLTFTTTAPDGLRGLVNDADGKTNYTASVLLYKIASGAPKAETLTMTNGDYSINVEKDANGDPKVTLKLAATPGKGDVYLFYLSINAYVKDGEDTLRLLNDTSSWTLNVVNEQTAIPNAPIKMSAALTPDSAAPTAAPYSNTAPYMVESTTWYSDESCTTGNEVTSFEAGKMYYAKVILKPNTGYKFAYTTQTPVSCDDPNASYSRNSPTVAEDGSSLSVVVKATARAALTWQTVPTSNQTCTLSADSGYGSLTLTAQATGGDTSKSISYRLYAQKAGSSDAVIKASASTSDTFNAVCSFGKDDTGTYTCWFEATRGDVTITSDKFTVTVGAPEVKITNQSGDVTVTQGNSARLWVKAVGLGLSYQWQVKNGDTWENVTSDGNKYDYVAKGEDVGDAVYRCVVSDKYGSKPAESKEITVHVTKDEKIAPAFPIASINEKAVDLETKYEDHIIPANSENYSIEYPKAVEAGQKIELHATYVLVPNGYYMSADKKTAEKDYYYDKEQYTAVAGTVSVVWKGTAKDIASASSTDFQTLVNGEDAEITIPDALTTDKYYVKLEVTNTVSDSTYYRKAFSSNVTITFNVSPKHEHTYTDHYAQLDGTQHTAYCACGDYKQDNHDTSGTDGACSKCGYTPAKTYNISVTGGTASEGTTTVTEAKAGATIALTASAAPTGSEFDKWEGNVTVTKSSGTYSFTMPSHDVVLWADYKTVGACDHSYTWVDQGNGLHKGACSKCNDVTYGFHTYPDTWTNDASTGKHTHACTAGNCTATESADHEWVYDKQTKAPTLTAEGEAQYKCSAKGCDATKTEPIAKLNPISEVNVTVTAPVRGNTPENASADSSAAYYVAAYYVADTQWEPTVSGTFAGGTKYTVKVSLEAVSGCRFTSGTTFKINGQTAKLVSTTPGADGVDNVAISYEFPATSSGSSSGGGGGSSSSAYTVTVKDAKNGSVTADRKTASAGTTVTLTVSPNQGWTLETLTAANASGKEIELTIVKVGEKYTFKMPSSNVTVNATFMEDNTILNYFVDVPTNSYYYDAVLWAVDKGITQGTDDSHFNPSGICTRAQAVTFLWRAAGSPAPKATTMPFTDVKSGVYYYDAVLWAVENGITKGTSATTFSPNMNCSRAQIVTFLWRSEKSPAAGTVNPFTDVKTDAYYADAVLWAVKEDVTKGTTDTTFSPDANCTRAQIVTFIYRCMK